MVCVTSTKRNNELPCFAACQVIIAQAMPEVNVEKLFMCKQFLWTKRGLRTED